MTDQMAAMIRQGVRQLSHECFQAAIDSGWYMDKSGAPRVINIGERLMLCVSELAEAMEGHRKKLKDDHLPDRSMFECELADCVIRIMDLAGYTEIDLAGAITDKLAYNRQRPDHKLENRAKEGGKEY